MSQALFKNPYVFSAPVLTGSSIGNGTLTIDKLTHFTVNQKYIVVCTATNPFTVFNVVGEFDGAVGVAVVGTPFYDIDLKVFLTIQQGPTLFAVGDTFNFEVKQGTDVNQQNLDAYDELPQKNFGTGVTGENKGDNNIRFSGIPVAAKKTIGDLLFQAINDGSEGNQISIEYLLGTVLSQASKVIQSLTFTANTPGAAGNNIQIQYNQFTAAIKATRIIQDIEYQADIAGTGGNAISIQYTNTATAGSETVNVVGNAITIGIQSGVTTVNQILIALGLSAAASALIDYTETGTGFETQTTQTALFLTGGVNAIGAAGFEVVQVVGNIITIILESGVSTAQQVYDKVIASAPALSLITPTITGNALTVQTAPVGISNLTGGADNDGDPGNEIVTVSSKQIKVKFVPNLSTATQIRNKLLASAAAMLLVTVSLTGTGAELQTSPVARTFLAGGSESGTYALNQNELTDPSNFYEGNAPLLLTDLVNQGNEVTLGETLKKGKVTLDDDIPANLPGPIVESAQQTINNLIQNGKCFLVSENDLKVEWSKPAGTLLLNGNISLIFAENGIKNTILNTDGPFTLADGEHLYWVVDRFNNLNVTLIKSTTVPNSPNGENVFRLVSRVGSSLYWWDNTCQREGKKIRIGEGGSAGAWQEKLGVGNGSNKNFPIPSGLFPISQESIIVFSNTTHFVNTEWVYNVAQNQIEFVDAPAAGVEPYIYFLTDGETITVPSPTGVQQVLYRTITLGEETAKQLTLPISPSVPNQVLTDVVGGTSQIFGTDFTVSGLVFSWSGLGLDGYLTAGDVLRITYYS